MRDGIDWRFALLVFAIIAAPPFAIALVCWLWARCKELLR